MRWLTVTTLAVLAGLGTTGSGFASPLYFQGFETNTSGWNVDTGGDNNGGITRVASGGGVLGLNAPNPDEPEPRSVVYDGSREMTAGAEHDAISD